MLLVRLHSDQIGSFIFRGPTLQRGANAEFGHASKILRLKNTDLFWRGPENGLLHAQNAKRRSGKNLEKAEKISEFFVLSFFRIFAKSVMEKNLQTDSWKKAEVQYFPFHSLEDLIIFLGHSQKEEGEKEKLLITLQNSARFKRQSLNRVAILFLQKLFLLEFFALSLFLTFLNNWVT